MEKKKILIVTPKFPYPATGACEQDRFWGIKDFIRYGFEVRVITKLFGEDKAELAVKIGNDLKIKIFPIQYKFGLFTKKEKIKNLLFRFLHPLYLDGAAFEYAEPEIQRVFKEQIEEWNPDFAWFDYTYLWPLYDAAREKKIPIITRSINFEATHFLLEDGITFINLLKSIPKFLTEFIALGKSDLFFSITPKEEKIYKKIDFKKIVRNLPLRGMPHCLKSGRVIKKTETLHIFFMGSTYNVHHNREAAEFILKKLAPELQKRMPDKFIFHILGGKLPKGYDKYFNENVKYEGYVENLESFLDQMDIALIPSLSGAGMQQKIFEPLARGIPTITSPRGLAGYEYKDGEHLFLANDENEFVEKLLNMRDINLRKKLSGNSMKLSAELFSREKIFSAVFDALDGLK